MMRHYRNKKTGQVIKTTGKVSGLNWELLEDATAHISADDIPDEGPIEDDIPDEGPIEDDIPDEGPVEDDIPDEEPAAEEPPIEKPKTTRRGKK